jgi:hypothetical protein
MKLGTQTNSLTNHILSRSVIGQPDPEVGMGATLLHWTDRDGGTITKVWTWRQSTYIQVQVDRAIRTDTNGMSECQSYRFEPNPIGNVHTFRKLDGGMWQAVRLNIKTQRWVKTEGSGLRIGEREAYHDYSF